MTAISIRCELRVVGCARGYRRRNPERNHRSRGSPIHKRRPHRKPLPVRRATPLSTDPCPSTGIRSDAKKNTIRDFRRRLRRCGEVAPWGSEPCPRAFDKRQRPQENEGKDLRPPVPRARTTKARSRDRKVTGKAPRLHRSRTESLEGQFQPAENLLPTALATAMPLPAGAGCRDALPEGVRQERSSSSNALMNAVLGLIPLSKPMMPRDIMSHEARSPALSPK